MRAEDRDGLAGLNQERLVVLEAAQRVDDRVERGPGARGLAGAAVHDQVVGPLRHLRSRLFISMRRAASCGHPLQVMAGAARRADVAAESAHQYWLDDTLDVAAVTRGRIAI
jgi:hypothetical protein